VHQYGKYVYLRISKDSDLSLSK